jgi:CheY-like chemotaxis protein
MLAFSRLQNLEPAVLDVNALIAGMRDMIAGTLGETIEVDVRCAPDLWPTFADGNQLETALLKIPAGCYVRLAVADTGCGIASDVLPKVFEPFFTTKDTGRGSGLGLSMVYGFVSQSGGHVRIDSREGAGTRVRIHLPRAAAAGASVRESAHHANDAGPMPRARPGETVLLVEDNDDVRRLGVEALEQLGYVVLPAADGRAALRVLDDRHEARIDLLFTDVVLPGGMTGFELARAIRARRAGLPALFTSGYAAGRAASAGFVDGEAPLLSKPYGIEALASAIRQAIDARAGTPTS